MPKTMSELREQLRTMQDEMNELTDMGMRMAGDENATREALDKHRGKVSALEGRMQLVRDEIARREGNPEQVEKTDKKAEKKEVRDMRKSNEYARAFVQALNIGLTPSRSCPSDNMRILYDALTISGGSTPGEDGGFLVPEDVDHQIHELMRDMGDITDLFEEEAVNTNSGWRVKDVSPTTGFTALSGEAVEESVPEDDQPEFSRVAYTLTTYGLNVPMSRELLQDEVANVLAYLSRWFAKKLVITRNGLMLGKLNTLASQDITAAADYDAVAAVKKLLNVALDPMLSPMAAMITNQDGFNYLDTLADLQGRPLLQPDVTSGEVKIFGSRRIRVLSNDVLPSQEGKAPLYVGAFKQFATLFNRMPMEIASTEVGGKAWRSNSVEVRAIARMGASIFDEKAAVRRMLPVNNA